MVNESRIAIYNYLKPLFAGVTGNIYSMRVPAENTEDDVTNGFLVIEVGNIRDASEFDLNAYAAVRCFVSAYVPQKNRGRLDEQRYAYFEDGVIAAIRAEIDSPSSETYSIESDGILSMDDEEETNKGNQYSVFVKSFIVIIS